MGTKLSGTAVHGVTGHQGSDKRLMQDTLLVIGLTVGHANGTYQGMFDIRISFAEHLNACVSLNPCLPVWGRPIPATALISSRLS